MMIMVNIFIIILSFEILNFNLLLLDIYFDFVNIIELGFDIEGNVIENR